MGQQQPACRIPFFKDLHDQTDVFDGVFGRAPTTVNLFFENSTEPVGAEIVTGTYFPVLGVRPQLGRLLNESDDRQPDAHPVVVLSYDYWQKHLGSRGGHRRPHRSRQHASDDGCWRGGGRLPRNRLGRSSVGLDPDDDEEAGDAGFRLAARSARRCWLHVFGRLKPGMTMAAGAGAPAAVVQGDVAGGHQARGLAARDRQSADAHTLRRRWSCLPASGGRSDLRGRLERPLFVLLAATALVLLLACLNVANLFLARGFARRRETALCLALGASRSRVVRDLLIQCGLVAVGGGVLGVAMARSSRAR